MNSAKQETLRLWATRSGVLAAVAGFLVVATASPAQADDRGGRWAAESVEISDFYVFNTDQKVNGATILVRDFVNRVIDVDLSIDALDPGGAYSIWVAVFNNPWYCSDACGLDDLPGINPAADKRVRPSVFYGGGFLADSGGSGTASFKIVPGRTSRELFAATENYGLERLWGSEIHIVLRSHGAAVTGSVANQIGTASGTCNTATGMCQNVFTSFHPPLD